MAQSSYQQINLTNDITLSWPFSFQQPPIIYDINNVSATLQTQVACYGATTVNLVAIYNNGTSGVGATLTNNDTLTAFNVDELSPAPSLGDRILVKNQTPLSNTNGIYTLTTIGNGSTPWILTRATDYDTPSEIQRGDFILVTNGTVNANKKWIQTSTIISVGTSSPNFINRDFGWTITLPDATLTTPGQNFQFKNISLFPFQILAHDGITNIANISSGDLYYLYLNDNSTPNGNWNPERLTNGSSSISSVIVDSPNSTIAVTNGALTPPGGKIHLDVATSLVNLNNLSPSGGFLVSTGTGTWTTRDLVSGGNIVITNGDGVTTDPVIDINSKGIIGIASAGIGDLQLSGNLITTTVTNGGIQLSSAGTGKVSINGMQIDTSSNITGGNNLTLTGSLTIGGSFVSPTTPKVIFNFTNTSVVPVGNTIVQLSQYNVASVTGSNGTYIITFTTPLASANYAVNFGSGSNGGTPNANHVYVTLKTPGTLTIAVIDGSGVLVPYSPDGIWGTIWLPT